MASALSELHGDQQHTLSGEAAPKGVTLGSVTTGPDAFGTGLQVLVAEWAVAGQPPVEAIRRLHSQRLGKKVFPLVAVLTDGASSAWLMGPNPDASAVGPIPETHASRMLQAALDEPSGLAGRQRIAHLLRSLSCSTNRKHSTPTASALGADGSIGRLLEGSDRYATGLGVRLRQRIYEEAIPMLAIAVAHELERVGYRVGGDYAHAYRITLRILFRLLFQAYAEDRGLLPYGRNDRYTRNSLKRWALDLVEQPDLEFDPNSHAIWDDLQQVWGVIDTGNTAWDVPAYNGGLFGTDPDLHPGGAVIASMQLNDAAVGHALRHLLVDDTVDGEVGAVDFRTLSVRSVREFGTIYEGLLESSLSRADQNLTLDKNAAYVPAGDSTDVVVASGDIYFHNASGQRKATGSPLHPPLRRRAPSRTRPRSRPRTASRERRSTPCSRGPGGCHRAVLRLPRRRPRPEMCLPLLEDLIAYLRTDDHPALLQAAVAHVQFETIHPFGDGNGRAGRAILYGVLKQRCVPDGMMPPVSLALSNNRDGYLDSLREFQSYVGDPHDPGRSAALGDWLEVLAEAVQRSSAAVVRYQQAIAALQNHWRATVGGRAKRSAAAAIIDYLPANPSVTSQTLADATGYSARRCAEALRRLENAGVVKSRSVGPSLRVYDADKVYEAFNVMSSTVCDVNSSSSDYALLLDEPLLKSNRRAESTGSSSLVLCTGKVKSTGLPCGLVHGHRGHCRRLPHRK